MELLKQIIIHILNNFGLLNSNLKSLKEFKLDNDLFFDKENHFPLYGCKISDEQTSMNVLCSELDENEYCLLVEVPGNNIYAIYYSNDEYLMNFYKGSWIECGTYLQAILLAGLEMSKNIGLPWVKFESNVLIMKDFLNKFVYEE